MNIIEMAKEAGFSWDVTSEVVPGMLEKFATAIRAEERKLLTPVATVGEAADIQWYEGITDDEAPEGTVLYIWGGGK